MLSDQVRQDLEALAALDRGSATKGEAQAAELLAEMLRARGVEPVLERERAVGEFWTSGFLAAAAGLLATVLPGRAKGTALGLAAAGLLADDVDSGRHLLRKALPHRRTTNVIAWAGDRGAAETVVFVAHHDAARTGLLFWPGLVPFVDRVAPDYYAKQTTSTQTGQLLVAGPTLAALGAATGNRWLKRLGFTWCAAIAGLMADVGRSPVVPGANDNLSAVAVLLALAERLREEPVHGVRVGLLSTGSEESFMEGMRAFVARHRGDLDPRTTRFVALECVGSPHLMVMEGEGMLVLRDYDERLRDDLQGAADDIGVSVWRGLRLGAGGTDALPALKAGYASACLAACTDLKTPANYHWPTDVPENLSWETIRRAAAVCDRLVRRAAAPAPAG
jgi:hypothetical protein